MKKISGFLSGSRYHPPLRKKSSPTEMSTVDEVALIMGT
jgi:hypothetical protein